MKSFKQFNESKIDKKIPIKKVTPKLMNTAPELMYPGKSSAVYSGHENS